MVPVTPAPYQQHINTHGGNNSFANGIQNIHEGRDFLQNNFTGEINVTNCGRDDPDDDDGDNQDRPFPPGELRKALKLFKQQHPKVNHSALKKEGRQQYLNRWRHLIIIDLPDKAKNNNRLGKWRVQQSDATYHQDSNNTTQSGSQNYSNFASGVQNFYQGRDFHQNNGAGRIVINHITRGGSDKDDKDRPLSLENFRTELKTFKRLYHGLHQNEVKKRDGQEYSEIWQPPSRDLPGENPFRTTDIVDAMERLPNVSRLPPTCLRSQHVGIEDVDLLPNAQSADAEVFKGKVGTLDAIAKAPKKELGPDGEQLKVSFC
ncbi:hypothetical protein PQX77_020997 [Marasmius sp. AFHP31]|nr:hypothetical protein PQX77_020997 [Marasmius sp. AFHP31]